MATSEYSIAVGWNVSLSSSHYIENLTPTSPDTSWKLDVVGNPYFFVHGQPLSNNSPATGYEEARQFTLGRTNTAIGDARVQWVMAAHSASYDWFYTTYVDDSTNMGRVSIRTILRRDGSYVDYNATIFAAETLGLRGYDNNGVAFNDILLTFLLESAI